MPEPVDAVVGRRLVPGPKGLSTKAEAWMTQLGAKAKNLNGTERCVLNTLLAFVNANGWAWPSFPKVVELSGCPRSSVARAYASLDRKAIVERHQGAGFWFPGWPETTIANRDLHLNLRAKAAGTETKPARQRSQVWDQNKGKNGPKSGTRKQDQVPQVGQEQKIHDLFLFVASLLGYQVIPTNNNSDAKPKASHVVPVSKQSRSQSSAPVSTQSGLTEGALLELEAFAKGAQARRQAYAERQRAKKAPVVTQEAPEVTQAVQEASEVVEPKHTKGVSDLELPSWLLPVTARTGCAAKNLAKLLETFGEKRLRSAYEVVAQTYPDDSLVKSSFGALLRRAAENGWTTKVVELRREKDAHEQKLVTHRPAPEVVAALRVATGEVLSVCEHRAHGVVVEDANGQRSVVVEDAFDQFLWSVDGQFEAWQPEEAREAVEAPQAVASTTEHSELVAGPSPGRVAVSKASGAVYVIKALLDGAFAARREDGVIVNVPEAHYEAFDFVDEVSRSLAA